MGRNVMIGEMFDYRIEYNTYIDSRSGHCIIHKRWITSVDVLKELAGAVGFEPSDLVVEQIGECS